MKTRKVFSVLVFIAALSPLEALAGATCQGPAPGERLSLVGCKPGDKLVLREVKFDTDKSIIKPSSMRLLDQVAEVLLQNPQLPVSIDGHTDSRASDAYNIALSQRRATAVVNYLMAAGVPASGLRANGYGLRRPMATNETAEGRALNRRVELTLVAEGSDVAPELDVYISTFSAKPSSLTVPVGSSVKWHNYDEISHDVTFSDTASSRIWTESWKGSTYSRSFDAPGTYSYKCSVHNDVAGKIVVTGVNEVKTIASPAYGGQTTTSYRPSEKTVPYSGSLARNFSSPAAYSGSPSSSSSIYQEEATSVGSADYTVEIKDFAFGPERVVIPAGSKVSWGNADSSRHTVSFEAEESDVLFEGDSFAKSFNAPGEYKYQCGLHSSMKGVIVVK